MTVSRSGFTRFYVFNADGVLSPFAVLDSEGHKFIPRLCTSCHAGGGTRSDVGSIFREFEPSVLEEAPGVTRAQAEAEWLNLNRAIRQANQALRSESAGAPSGTDHAKTAILLHLDSMYTSTNPVVSRSVHDPARVPPSWLQGTAQQNGLRADLFEKAINPYCMPCHRTNTVDFSDYSTFLMVASQQDGKALIQRYLEADPTQPGPLTIMPQAQLTFQNLHADEAAQAAIAAWLAQGDNP
jgi:hypothetical protein